MKNKKILLLIENLIENADKISYEKNNELGKQYITIHNNLYNCNMIFNSYKDNNYYIEIVTESKNNPLAKLKDYKDFEFILNEKIGSIILDLIINKYNNLENQDIINKIGLNRYNSLIDEIKITLNNENVEKEPSSLILTNETEKWTNVLIVDFNPKRIIRPSQIIKMRYSYLDNNKVDYLQYLMSAKDLSKYKIINQYEYYKYSENEIFEYMKEQSINQNFKKLLNYVDIESDSHKNEYQYQPKQHKI